MQREGRRSGGPGHLPGIFYQGGHNKKKLLLNLRGHLNQKLIQNQLSIDIDSCHGHPLVAMDIHLCYGHTLVQWTSTRLYVLLQENLSGRVVKTLFFPPGGNGLISYLRRMWGQGEFKKKIKSLNSTVMWAQPKLSALNEGPGKVRDCHDLTMVCGKLYFSNNIHTLRTCVAGRRGDTSTIRHLQPEDRTGRSKRGV